MAFTGVTNAHGPSPHMPSSPYTKELHGQSKIKNFLSSILTNSYDLEKLNGP